MGVLSILKLVGMAEDNPDIPEILGFSFDMIFVVMFIGLEALILITYYYYSGSSTSSGPLGLRNKHMKPFVVGLMTISIGIILGFFYITTVGNELDIFNRFGLSLVALLSGITFGFLIFMRGYRKKGSSY